MSLPQSWRIAMSRAFNLVTGGRRGVTFSAQSEWRARHGSNALVRKIGHWSATFINWFTKDPDHCVKAYRLEISRGGF